MKRTEKTAVFAIIALFIMLSMSYAADVAKIGVVDFQQVLANSSAGKAARAKINKEGKKMEKDLKEKSEEIESLNKELERDSLVMSRDNRENKAREIRIKINDIKTLQKKYMEEFKLYEKKIVRQIQKDVLDLLEEMGKKGGYLLIVEKGTILYAPDSVDITDELIKRYNIRYARNN
jgi:outer membrane protein